MHSTISNADVSQHMHKALKKAKQESFFILFI